MAHKATRIGKIVLVLASLVALGTAQRFGQPSGTCLYGIPDLARQYNLVVETTLRIKASDIEGPAFVGTDALLKQAGINGGATSCSLDRFHGSSAFTAFIVGRSLDWSEGSLGRNGGATTGLPARIDRVSPLRIQTDASVLTAVTDTNVIADLTGLSDFLCDAPVSAGDYQLTSMTQGGNRFVIDVEVQSLTHDVNIVPVTVPAGVFIGGIRTSVPAGSTQSIVITLIPAAGAEISFMNGDIQHSIGGMRDDQGRFGYTTINVCPAPGDAEPLLKETAFAFPSALLAPRYEVLLGSVVDGQVYARKSDGFSTLAPEECGIERMSGQLHCVETVQQCMCSVVEPVTVANNAAYEDCQRAFCTAHTPSATPASGNTWSEADVCALWT